MAFGDITEEQRREALAKGKEVIARKKEESKKWKHTWADEALWAFLRKKTGIRAVPSYIHCSEEKYIRRTLKTLGKDRFWWQEHFFPKYSDFAEHNPLVPMYVLQGIMIEAAHPEYVAEFRTEE